MVTWCITYTVHLQGCVSDVILRLYCPWVISHNTVYTALQMCSNELIMLWKFCVRHDWKKLNHSISILGQWNSSNGNIVFITHVECKTNPLAQTTVSCTIPNSSATGNHESVVVLLTTNRCQLSADKIHPKYQWASMLVCLACSVLVVWKRHIIAPWWTSVGPSSGRFSASWTAEDNYTHNCQNVWQNIIQLWLVKFQ